MTYNIHNQPAKPSPNKKHAQNALPTTLNLDDFRQECIQEMTNNRLPLVSGDLKTDGRIYRYSCDAKQSQKDEWYVAHELPNNQLCVSYGSWSHTTEYNYRSWKKESSLSRPTINKLNQIYKEKLAHINAEIQKEQDIEAKRAAEIWKKG